MKPAAAWLLVAVLALTSCGVPVQSDPVPLEPGTVPSQLRDGGSAPSPQPSTATGKSPLRVNFVRNDRLVSIRREAPAGASAERLTTVIQDLVAGPTTTEQANGITTALPPNLNLTVAEVQGSRVVLELSGDTEGRSATENVLAVAQIVLSVTALPPFDEVTISRGGVPVEALLADGALTTDPLTAADYASLRSR
ncbi:GerMN domain-containing protein [Kribbella sp.]|uniref:GerMN domain-containing protein n=1 Tax=Kribbella sp. TaxID=1871183 RepID=UPI002D3E6A0D|nr:GerMN domain-containing protein [Kribbella sp.]HZX07901.1 GerMN domain-containing protein [Kribbella sp.]